MKRIFFLFLLLSWFASGLPSRADEGMWLYNAFPKDKVKAKYGFEPTRTGSITFVFARFASTTAAPDRSSQPTASPSPTITSAHMCVQQLSTHGHDYIKEGFSAKTQAEEAKCPDLELNELVGIEDVTAKIKAP